MNSLCGIVDCVSCLKDGRFWLKLHNNTKCCVWNVATFGIDYDQLLQPGDEDMCPMDHSSSVLAGVLGSLAGLGLVVGVGVGVGCWIRSIRMERRLNLVEGRARRGEEQTRLLSSTTVVEPNSLYSVVNERGEAAGVGRARGGGGNDGSGDGAYPQRSRVGPVRHPVSLYSARSRRSLAALPYRLSDSDSDNNDNFVESRRREGQYQPGITKDWRRAAAAGAKLSRSKTTELGGKKVTEMFEMIPL